MGADLTGEGSARPAPSVMLPEGRTASYDAVVQGLRHLQRGHAEKKMMIVISDGGDNASRDLRDRTPGHTAGRRQRHGRHRLFPTIELRRPGRDPVSRNHRAVRRVAQMLCTAGLLALEYVAYVILDAKAYQTIEQRRFEQTRPDAAPAPAIRSC